MRAVARLLAVIFLAAGCSAPPNRADLAPKDEGSRAAATTGSAALAREVRYYRDERGQVWDDRGRNLGVVPMP